MPNDRGGVNYGAAMGERILITVSQRSYTVLDDDGNKQQRLGTNVGRERAIPKPAATKGKTAAGARR